MSINTTKTSSNNNTNNTLLSSSISSSVSYLNPTQASNNNTNNNNNPFVTQPNNQQHHQPQHKMSSSTTTTTTTSSTTTTPSSLESVYEADPELRSEWQRLKTNKPDTKAMVRQLEETRQMGAHTLETLHSQGEQLNVIEAMNNEHGDVLTQSESYVRRLSGIGGRIADKFRRKSKSTPTPSQMEAIAKKHENQNEQHKSKDKDDKKQTASQSASQNSAELFQKSDGSTVSYDKRTGHPEGLTDEQLKMVQEEDRDLDAMSDILSNMKAMGHAANTELKSQEAKIDRINDQVDNNTYRLKRANIKLGK